MLPLLHLSNPISMYAHVYRNVSPIKNHLVEVWAVVIDTYVWNQVPVTTSNNNVYEHPLIDFAELCQIFA